MRTAVSSVVAMYQRVLPIAAGVARRRGASCAGILIAFTMLAVTLATSSGALGQADAPHTLLVGTRLYIRLQTAASTKTSHLHQTVAARVVREVVCDQGILVPLGTEVAGKIEKLIPASDPTDHARMLIRFTQLTIPHHSPLTLTAHITEVENAREAVLPDGTIQGVLAKDAAAGRLDNLLDKLGSAGGTMEGVSGKTFGKVDTSLDFPVGTDLVLTLDQPLAVDLVAPPEAAIAPELARAIQKLLVEAPQRAESKTKKPGDPLNLVIIGDSNLIQNAFKAAGWSEARKLGARSAVETVRAMASNQGYGEAPVSQLYLFGRAEDLAFEKMLDTFLKRHHLRLWRSDEATADGREIWLGSSTHDIGLDIHPGVVSHEIDPDLDAERAKVGADLLSSGWVAAEQLVSRPNPLSQGKTATGGTWKTDGQLLVIELKRSGV